MGEELLVTIPPPPALGTAHPLGRAVRLGMIGAVLLLGVFTSVPLCPFAIITRHPCPGCGLTRATVALLHGHVLDALRFHPLSLVVAPLVVAGGIANAVSYVRTGRWSAVEGLRGRWVTRAMLLLGVAMVCVWIARFLGALGGPVPV